MINKFVDKMIAEINDLGNNANSPDFSIDDAQNVAITTLNGSNQECLTNASTMYSEIPFRLLVRAENDGEALRKSEELMNYLKTLNGVEFDNGKIVRIIAQTPNFAFRDENLRVYYNTFFNAIIEGRN